MIPILTMYLAALILTSATSDGQSCVDTVNVRQSGDNSSPNNRQAIVQGSEFSCNGRITGYLISLERAPGNSPSAGYPSVQVWHRTSLNSPEHTRVDTECPLTESDINDMGGYYLGNVSCVESNRIEFQSGDVIGYRQGAPMRYRLWNINNAGYTSYHCDGGNCPLDTFNIANNVDSTADAQPLIQLMFDIRCDDLSAPANGEIMSCSSGRVGVGYEGDTCSFTCNTGYELTGSDTRTCQSNGSWSGTDVMCLGMATSTSMTSSTSDTVTSIETAVTSNIVAMATSTIMTSSTSDMTSIETAATSNIVAMATSTSMTSSTSGIISISVGAPATSIVVISTTTTTSTIEVATDTITSTSSETSRSFMTSVNNDSIPSAGARQEQNDDSGSGVGGIVAGCVVAFIVFVAIVVCFIIFLIWYRTKKKRFQEQNDVQVSKQSAYKNTVYDNPNYYSSADQFLGAKGHTTEPMPYLDPVETIGRVVNDDYEVIPKLDNYEQPQPIDDVHYEVADYPLSTGSIILESSTLPTGEALPQDEEIYEDPGHVKEEIYEWFKQRSICKLDRSSVSISNFIGSGEFGTVHLGLWSNGSTDPVQVAVKTLNSQCSESDRVKFLREAAIMGQFVHNNVVQLHGVVTEEENMMIVLEYMPKGDLQNHLLKTKALTIKSKEADSELKHDLLSYCRQIALGLNYLASKQFVHRDLAARNILVSSDDVCKIADFGMARDVADDNYYVTTGGKIPLKWTSPEAIFYKKYSVQSDVWSFGCVIYEVWSLGHKPFKGYSGNKYVEKITTGYRLPPPPGCPRAVYELMIECWHPEATYRPHPGMVLRTLQKSDRNLLQWSMPDDDKTDGQVAMLGAPLTASEQLYPDLQSTYMKHNN